MQKELETRNFIYEGKTDTPKYIDARIKFEEEEEEEEEERERLLSLADNDVDKWILTGAPIPLSLDQKFKLCFLNPYKENDSYIEMLIQKYPIDENSFHRLLFNTEIEEFAPKLKILGLNEMNKGQQNENESILDDLPFDVVQSDAIGLSREAKLYQSKELIETLIFLFENKNSNTSLTLKSGKLKNNNHKTSNKDISDALMEGLITKLIERSLNTDYLSYEDAKYEILNLKDIDWIENWIERYIQENDLSRQVGKEVSININNPIEYIDNDMINSYCEEHFSERPITLQFLYHQCDLIKINKTKKKRGAKPKNDSVASVAERLSYLIRLKRFLNQNEVNDISKFSISNKDCRLIHDYLVIFQLIPNQRKRDNTTTTPENYIKALIQNYRKNRKYVSNMNNMVHFLINSYKQTGIYPIH
jgi:hypothetical protein